MMWKQFKEWWCDNITNSKESFRIESEEFEKYKFMLRDQWTKKVEEARRHFDDIETEMDGYSFCDKHKLKVWSYNAKIMLRQDEVSNPDKCASLFIASCGNCGKVELFSIDNLLTNARERRDAYFKKTKIVR